MKERAKLAIENAVIFLAIFTLWPVIVGYRATWYKAFLCGVAVVLGLMLAKRMRRFRKGLLILILIPVPAIAAGALLLRETQFREDRLPRSSPEMQLYRREIQQAETAARDGEMDGAVTHWKKALELNPGAVELYHKMGIVSIGKREFGKAAALYEEALRRSPQTADFHYHLALARLGEEDYQGCLSSMDETLSINAYYPRAHYVKGIVYEQTGRQEQAEEEFIAEINVDPGSRLAWLKVREAHKRELRENANTTTRAETGR